MRNKFVFLLGLALSAPGVHAKSFPLPAPGESLVGEIGQVEAHEEDTLVEIARRFGIGYEELTLANPAVDRWLPGEGTSVLLPTKFILPQAPREGIVVNIAEMRLYYFPKPERGKPAMVHTYAVGVGRDDWNTPQIVTRVSSKLKNPAWYPPRAIRREHAARGDRLRGKVPPGPKNPLGPYVLKLGIPGGYFIHGTPAQFGIGMPVTHGCLRLYPEDMEALFKMVPVDTPVRIVNQPYKTAWQSGVLYVEAHPPSGDEDIPDFKGLAKKLKSATRRHPKYAIDWVWVEGLALHPRGVPLPVGRAGGADVLSG